MSYPKMAFEIAFLRVLTYLVGTKRREPKKRGLLNHPNTVNHLSQKG